jgi:hypothetical protein
MTPWSLCYDNQRYLFADWGLSQLRRTLQGQVADKVTFEQCIRPNAQAGSTLGPLPHLETHQPVSLFRGETLWFTGVLARVSESYTAAQGRRHYTVLGPWWYLDHIVFQQPWRQYHAGSAPQSTAWPLVPQALPAPDVAHDALTCWVPQGVNDPGHYLVDYRTHVILGQDAHGQPLTAKAQVLEILQYACRAGAQFSIGQLDLDFAFPFDEVKDISCAEALKRILRWCPDVVPWFDYTAPVPVLHFTACSAGQQAFAVPWEQCLRVEARQRHDLNVPVVVLRYEQPCHIGGVTRTDTHIDQYPKEADPQGLRSLVMTVSLQGASAITLEQHISTEAIDPYDAAWWQKHLAYLRNLPPEKIQLRQVSLGDQDWSNQDCPWELTCGVITPWMEAQGVRMLPACFRATLAYEDSAGNQVLREACVRFVATNARTGSYRYTVPVALADPVPEGLAKRLYEALHTLTWEGSVTLSLYNKEKEPTQLDWHPGQRLYLAGGPKAWEGHQAIVQRVDEAVDTGECVLLFGPPQHLGPKDFVDLMQASRYRNVVRSAQCRQAGQVQGGQALPLGGPAAYQTPEWGDARYTKLILGAEAQGSSICLDAAQLGPGLCADFKEECICQDGVLMKRRVLCSQPYPAQEPQIWGQEDASSLLIDRPTGTDLDTL